MQTTTRFLKRLLIYTGVLLAVMAAVVFVFDPFFHYHKPWFHLKAVLTDKEYQCIGSLRTFDYNALIVGSSVTENYDNAWFDEDFQVKSIKAARSYGMTADLCYLMDAAWETHTIDYVFYNIDPSALANAPEVTFASTGCPMYLYDKNPFNDVKYLWNKTVLFEKIPYMIAQSTVGHYENGKSYNWAQWKEFSEDAVLSHYYRKQTPVPMLPETAYAKECEDNLTLLTAQVEAHPDTQFVFFFPPYSLLWWDTIERAGETDAYLYNEALAMERLLSYDNVEVFYFAGEEDFVMNLDNYMDTMHFTQEINHAMERTMADVLSGTAAPEKRALRMEKETVAKTIEAMRAMTKTVIPEAVAQYEKEGRLLVDLDDG